MPKRVDRVSIIIAARSHGPILLIFGERAVSRCRLLAYITFMLVKITHAIRRLLLGISLKVLLQREVVLFLPTASLTVKGLF